MMNRQRQLSILTGVFVSCVLGSFAQAADDDREYAVGKKVVNFILPDSTGNSIALSDFNDKESIVLFTMGLGCPISNLYSNELTKIQAEFEKDGLQIIGIHANAGVTQKAMAEHAKEFGINFPVLLDADQSIVDMLGIERTAEVLLLDNHRLVKYHGRIDDKYGYTYKNAKATRRDLYEAIKELHSDKPISVATTTPLGCLITHNPVPQGLEQITYAKHVSRIIQDRCQGCHRAGAVAPFVLTDYDDVRDFSEMIREVVLERRMPPWHADPRYGHFATDRSLSKEQLNTLISWIDSGAPLGDKNDLPAEKEYYEGWSIGKPDIVFQLPEEQTVPADGVIPYLHFTIPTNFEEDVWFSAAELLPDNAAVVHHIQIYSYVPEEGEEVDLNDASDNQNARAQRQRKSSLVCSFAPGEDPFVFPAGVAGRIPAGAMLRFTMHYTPTGKIEKDRSMFGLKLYQGTPQREAKTAAAFGRDLKIPPYQPNHKMEAEYTFTEDALMLSMHPHMHVRGKDMQYTAYYPDGSSEMLLSVPQYDFNWQNTYDYHEPKLMPAGTRLHVVGHYDNSPQNPANPDPSKTITFGPQTWDEMFIGYFNYTAAKTIKELKDEAPVEPGE